MKKRKYSFYEYCILNNKIKILELWDYDKNKISPQDIAFRSLHSVFLKCKNNHEWVEQVTTLILKNDCPYCMHHKASKDYNLQTEKPEIAKMWDNEKNYPLKATDVLVNSNKKVWWKCENNHEFYKEIMYVTKMKECPYCNKELISKDYNFAVLNPYLLEEWDYERNKKKPEEYYPNSKDKVWWICKYNPTHRWQASVSNRNRNTGCPKCYSEYKTSFPEQAIYYYLKKKFKSIKNRYVFKGKEIDIFIPSLNLGIEYDGVYHHDNKKFIKDLEKEKFLIEKGIVFLRIKEMIKQNYTVKIEDNYIYCNFKHDYSYLNEVIKEIINFINKKYNKNIKIIPNIKKDYVNIYNQYINIKKEKSLGVKYPELIKEWDQEKNGMITPYMISPGSGKSFYWKCKNNHSWQDTVLHRTKDKRNCPYCSHHRISYQNSFAYLKPYLIKYWDYEKNEILPKDVSINSTRMVYWKCENNHYWKSYVATLVKNENCPYCSKRKISKIYNLEVECPDLIKEWDYKKNKKLPSEYFPYSAKKVWWICKNNHSWLAKISNRVSLKRGCPYCSGYKISPDNSLYNLYPELMKEWNYEKNKGLNPKQLSKSSNKKVWWKCIYCGNEWETEIINRTRFGCGCHKCVYIRKSGSFTVKYPNLLKEWDYEKNINIDPYYLSSNSSKSIWWKCLNCGHSWHTRIIHRIEGSKCPKCHGKIIE